MAQNITLMGASYSDVPAVTLPKTGGGTARFDDVSETTATAADVASGKVFLAADGTVTTGTKAAPSGAVVVNADESYDVTDKATAQGILPVPFHAYINVTSNYWAYYNDSSTSFCFPIENGKTYTLTWADSYTSSLYRIAFTKSTNGPSTSSTSTSYRRSVYNAAGTAGVEQNGWVKTKSFTISNSSLKLCVIQVDGTTALWTDGSIYSWFADLMKKLTITIE